jgi:hypothetical protein
MALPTRQQQLGLLILLGIVAALVLFRTGS